jgi:hypothetical protein
LSRGAGTFFPAGSLRRVEENIMTQKIINFIRTASKDSQKGERKNLPTWEFFYTGTLWRLTRGSKTRNINPDPGIPRFLSER